MPIRVFAHHIEISDETRRYVTEKAQHLRRIFDGMITVRVTLEAEKQRRVAEIVANVSHGPPVVTRVTKQTLAEAIDLAFDKIEAQLRKHKDKLRNHHRVREHAATEPSPSTPEEASDTAGPRRATE